LERAQLCIVLPPDRRDEIVAMLLALIGPVSVATGCLKCRLFQDVVDENIVCWEEEWRTREDLYRHIASTQYRQILAALDLASTQPEVCFEPVLDRRGMELIVSVRSGEF
jgi:quinol monooxygenase YgiN